MAACGARAGNDDWISQQLISRSLCGQAPSDSEEFARFLVEAGINSISFNPDAILKGIETINKALFKIEYSSKTTLANT